MNPSQLIIQEANALGLTVSAHLPSQPFSSHFPQETRSLLLLGSTGGRFFEGFLRANQSGPDPLDAYTRESITRLVSQFAPGALGVYFPFEEPFLPFQQFARAAGLGVAGPLGILVSAEYGPWFALRACVALEEEAPEATLAPDICASCEAPCIAACPAGAVRREGLLVELCGQARHRGPCQDHCIAREACPVGVRWRYPREAIRFHHRGASLFFPKG